MATTDHCAEDALQLPPDETIGAPFCTADELREAASEFFEVYAKRPIPTNDGGMKSTHCFFAWFALKKIKPTLVIESGVWRGQSTWLIRQACPDAKIVALDPMPQVRHVTLDDAEYKTCDFGDLDITQYGQTNAVLFADDHQNQLERIMMARLKGVRYVLFDDNYPPGFGDHLTLKQLFEGSAQSPRAVSARAMIEAYDVMPPPVVSDATRFGPPWNAFRCKAPIWTYEYAPEPFCDDAQTYTWFSVVRVH